MVNIKPFRGLRYDPNKIGSLETVVAPPYDVISEKERASYHAASERNITHLILPPEQADDEYGSKYERAAGYLHSWVDEGVLQLDEHPSIYVYEQVYPIDGDFSTRRGFIALLELEELGDGVLPHEDTLSKPKADRLELVKACRSNLSPIFTMYPDPEMAVDSVIRECIQDDADIDIVDADGQRHRLWRITSEEGLSKIASLMSDKTVYIADGHHRYESALNYRKLAKEENPADNACNYLMAYFTNMHDPGPMILSAHRLINSSVELDLNDLIPRLEEYFYVETLQFGLGSEASQREKMLQLMQEHGKHIHALGMYLGNDSYHVLILRDENILERIDIGDHKRAWKKLDITILHKLVFDRILTDGEGIRDEDIIYVTDAAIAMRKVCDREGNVAFFLNPTSISQVKEMADMGENMPGKATYFYPKLLTGLVMRLFEEG